MEKAIIYARVSTKEQEQEGFSIPAQLKLLNEYAAKNSFQVSRVFKEAESAKTAGREQFSEMLQYLKNHPEIKHILVEKTDRLYRNLRDYVDLDFEKDDKKIHLVKESEILSTESKSHQKFIHRIKVLMAQNYSDNLSEEVIKGQTQKAGEGIYPSMAPIGYVNKIDDHTIIIDPKTAPLIKKAFELAATGQYSIRRLKVDLYKLGLRSARAKKELVKEAMARILRNPFYYGEYEWKGKRYKGTHKPLISKDLFDQVQLTMGFVQKPRMTKHDFPFSGTLTCGKCGCSIVAEEKTKPSGKRYIYYHCTNGKGSCEDVTYLRQEVIEAAFTKALEDISLNTQIIEDTRTALLQSSDQESTFRENQVKALTERYRKLESHVSNSYVDKLEGKITADFWEQKTAEWKAEQEQIEAQIKALRRANTDYMLEGIKLMELSAKAAERFKNAMTPGEKREMVNRVLSNPRVIKGNIEFSYKKPFDHFVKVADLEDWRGRRDSNSRPPA